MSLIVSPKVLESHGVVLGKTGAGKSTAMRHFVEYQLDHKKRVCIIDPKGDWWGLKADEGGKGPGYEIITFGDFKNPDAADVPIGRHSGKEIARLVVSGNRPCVIGMRGWMPAAQAEFWIDFASTVFNSNSAGGLFIDIDEIQNFAPKERVGYEGENMALYWTKKLLSEGRGMGLTIFCGSQRPQSVHNAVLTQCETLIAMRLLHDADCTAVENWLKRTRDKDIRNQIMTTIPELARGEAWVWSPEAKVGPTRLQFPMFKTFDSFAPTQQQKKVNRKTWADVDLDAVKDKLASVIEEAKQTDPKLLRQENATLRAQLNDPIIRQQLPDGTVPETLADCARGWKAAYQSKQATKTETKTIEKPVFKKGQFERVEKMEGRLVALFRELKTLTTELIASMNSAGVAAMHPNNQGVRMAPVRSPSSPSQGRELTPETPKRYSRMVKRVEVTTNSTGERVRDDTLTNAGDYSIAPRHQDIVDALAFFRTIGVEPCEKKQIAGFVTRSFNGNFRSDLSVLKSAGLIEYPQPGTLCLTTEGAKAVQKVPNVRTRRDLHQLWLNMLPPRHADILRFLLQEPENAWKKQDVALNVNREFNGNFRSDLSVLKTKGTIVYPSPGTVRISEQLLPPIPA